MADFENVESVASRKFDKVRADILIRRQAMIEGYRQYQTQKSRGREAIGLAILRTEVSALLAEVRQMLLKELDGKTNKIYPTIELLEADIESAMPAHVIKAMNFLDALLYSKRITQVDTRETIDPTDILAMNEKSFF